MTCNRVFPFILLSSAILGMIVVGITANFASGKDSLLLNAWRFIGAYPIALCAALIEYRYVNTKEIYRTACQFEGVFRMAWISIC